MKLAPLASITVAATSLELSAALARPATPSVLALPHGLHEGVPEDVYHQKVPGLASKHALDLVMRAPAAYRAWLDETDDSPTPAMVFGKEFHTACLEPHLYTPGKLTTAKGREDAERIAGMVAAVRAHPLAARLLELGRPEVTARWVDQATGIECKGRADLWVPQLRTLVDLKSCADASAEEFARSVAKFTYHSQDAFYRDGFGLATGQPVESFVFIAVEKTAPYLVAVYVLDDGAVTRGAHRNARALGRLADCLARDVWPGLPDCIQKIDLPRWAQDL